MCKQISDWLYRMSTGWVALAALVLFLLFTALVLPQQAARSEEETGSTESPDTSGFYTPSDLYRLAEAYGEQGRRAYVRARFTFDLVWPLVYTFFLVTAISWVFGKALPPGSVWRRLNLAPLLAAAFDFLENLATSLVMVRYPEQTAVVDTLAPVLTMLKWSFLGATFVLLLVGILMAALRWISGQSRSESGREG
jgi:hypothetical protein